MKEAYTNNIVRLQEQLIVLNEHLDQVNDCLSEKMEEVDTLKIKLERGENTHKAQKSEYNKKLKILTENIENIEEDTQKLQAKSSDAAMERLQLDHDMIIKQYNQQKVCMYVYVCIYVYMIGRVGG